MEVLFRNLVLTITWSLSKNTSQSNPTLMVKVAKFPIATPPGPRSNRPFQRASAPIVNRPNALGSSTPSPTVAPGRIVVRICKNLYIGIETPLGSKASMSSRVLTM